MVRSKISVSADNKEFTCHDKVPVILIVSWVNGIPMDLDLNLVETGSLVMTVFTTAFTLQVMAQIAKTDYEKRRS
jgi:hypothetical protein